MFWTFKLSFDTDILAFFAWQLFGLLKKFGYFFQSSGHPDFLKILINSTTSLLKVLRGQENNSMILLITTLHIIAILITLNTGDIT